MLDKFIDLLPEEHRAEFKGLIGNTIIVSNREDAAKAISENSFLKSERDAIISRTTDNYAVKFKEEKLPGLLEEEYKKKNPPKDAKDQAILDMQNQLADMKRQALLKDRRALAMQKLTESGLPVDLADFAIHEDENIFGSNIEKLSGLVAWKEAAIKQALTGAVGNQKPPQGGANSTLDFSKMSQTEVMKFAGQGQAEKEAVTKWLATKK